MNRFNILVFAIVVLLGGTFDAQAQCNIILQASVTPVTCGGSATGAIDITVLNATPPYSVVWSNGEEAEDLANITAGTYTAQVMDAAGCSAMTIKTLIDPPVILDTLVEICYPAQLNYNVTGGVQPYQYLWSTGDETDVIFIPTTIKTFGVTLTDAAGCQVSKQIDAGYPDIGSISPPTIACQDSSVVLDVSATSIFRPGTQLRCYYAEDVDSVIYLGPNLALPVQELGLYSYALVDSINGCFENIWLNVRQDINKPNVNAGLDQTLTCLKQTADLEATASGNGPMVYEWMTNNGHFASGTNTLQTTVDEPGNYTLWATNTLNGCIGSNTVRIHIDTTTPYAHPYANPGPGISCNGSPVTLHVINTKNLKFEWTGPNGWTSTLKDPVVDQPGEYQLASTDTVRGCTAYEYITVYPGPALSSSDFDVTHVPCIPGVLGSIDLTVNFAIPPYSFLWSNGATTEDIDNLDPGTYTVAVTSGNGCTYYGTAKVKQGNTDLSLGISSTLPQCFGSNDGSIDLIAANGTGPYTYQWSGPQNFSSSENNISNLSAGNYTVTVSDATHCSITGSANLSAPPALSLPSNLTSVSAPSCYGGQDGSIDVSPMGGVAPFTFDWSNDGPENPDNDLEDLSGIGTGTYILTITDAHGCSLVSNIYSVTQPAALQVNALVDNIPCGAGNPTGAIGLTVNGGTGPYTYVWTNGETTEDIVGLPVGTFTVTVTDAPGCTAVFSETVEEGTVLQATDFSITPASCQSGAADGAISLIAIPAGAVSPLNYQWSGPQGYSATDQDIQDLQAGAYDLNIIDATGCVFTANLQVDKLPGNMSLSLTIGPASCTEGTIESVVSGGVPPLNYEWSTGASTANLTYTIAGTYSLTVSDAGGCSLSASSTINNNIGLEMAFDVEHNLCGDTNNGAIQVTVNNGSSQYSYLWNNGQTDNSISNLSAGIYCVTVTDVVSACTAQDCVVINTTPAISAMVKTIMSPSCFGASNGVFEITVTDPGAGPFNWDLSGPVSLSGTSMLHTFEIPGLSSGDYLLSVSNATGCSSEVSGTLNDPIPVFTSIELLSNSCNFAVLEAQSIGGVAPISFSWDGPNGISGSSNTIVAPVSGTYQLTATDSHGCTGTSELLLELLNGGNCGYIQGRVILDNNGNCVADANEPGIVGWVLRAEGADTLYGMTDALGHYFMGVPTGDYKMTVFPPNGSWEICPGIWQATVAVPNDTAVVDDIPVKKLVDCPALDVSIGTVVFRRCFSSYMYVHYQNNGTDIATDAYVDVTIDPFVTFESSNLASQLIAPNIRRFFIGDVAIGESGTFNIKIHVSCNSVLGQTHCMEVHLDPDETCNTNPLWSGASLSLRSTCETDSLRFFIKNIGSGDLQHKVNYIVVEDAVMRSEEPIDILPGGDSIGVYVPANGSTWMVEVEQELYHPYPDPVVLSVEGCSSNGNFSTGYINQFPLNVVANAVDLVCAENVGSYDPNDKHSYPIGYGAEHYIRPGTEIEYQINFQNTGTDTAFNIVIIDTLSKFLDPASIQFKSSSAPCRFDLTGEGVTHFYLDNIMLPDSNVNEVASHGFVNFAIRPKKSALLGSVIENFADIYFDFNDPIRTNTTFHELAEKFISVGVWQPRLPLLKITAAPNPFSESTTINLSGLLRFDKLELHLFDARGKEKLRLESDSGAFEIRKNNLPNGVYFFQITQNGNLVGTGKLIVQ